MTPDILLIGQITVDDTVPELPGRWERRLGGNAFYSVAGARLWCDPGRIGMVARVPRYLPFDVFSILRRAGMATDGLIPCSEDALIEWIMYEEDGNRQSMPRNPALRDSAADMQTLYSRYLTHLGNISASFEDVPTHWLPAKAIHLAPQVTERHVDSCRHLAEQTDFLSLDPSPHYSRSLSANEIHRLLPGVTAFLPSQAEIQHLGVASDWHDVVADLYNAGFSEVVMKRGGAGCVLADDSVRGIRALPVAASSPMDLTGAGDAFSGAYAASRAIGFGPLEAAERAVVTAGMIIECSGTEEAFALLPETAEVRLNEYRKGR